MFHFMMFCRKGNNNKGIIYLGIFKQKGKVRRDSKRILRESRLLFIGEYGRTD